MFLFFLFHRGSFSQIVTFSDNSYIPYFPAVLSPQWIVGYQLLPSELQQKYIIFIKWLHLAGHTMLHWPRTWIQFCSINSRQSDHTHKSSKFHLSNTIWQREDILHERRTRSVFPVVHGQRNPVPTQHGASLERPTWRQSRDRTMDGIHTGN